LFSQFFLPHIQHRYSHPFPPLHAQAHANCLSTGPCSTSSASNHSCQKGGVMPLLC
jgi:hypothetical protein